MKAGSDFDLTRYATVAERITQFYCAYPAGRIVTELMSRSAQEVVFRASVFRQASDSDAAATGWASEREGDGDINAVACLENTETSAVGRALANLGFTASRLRPSAEEMAKAARVRARLKRPMLAVHEPAATPTRSPYLSDLLALVAAAERVGLRAGRAAAWRRHLATLPVGDELVLRLESRLRGWVARHGAGVRR